MIDQPGWTRIDAMSPAGLDAACADLEHGPLAERATLGNDPRWVMWHADGQDRQARIYALRRGDSLTGLASFLVHPSAVRLALGEMTLLARPVQRLNALAAPLVDARGDRQQELAQLSALFARIRDDLGPTEVIFLESVAAGTALFDLVGQSPGLIAGFRALRNGKLYRHRYASVNGSLDGYVKQLGARTRADLRSNRKRFAALVGQNYRTQCFRGPAEVPGFLAAATAVSRKTYQYRLLGSGLRDGEALQRRYLAASQRGWFRSYVLWADRTPIAFQVGFVHRERYYAQEIGYDPEWARHHVGIFLHTEIIADLAASDGAIREFDFGNGDNLHKERLSTRSQSEGYFYLIPAHLRGRLLVAGMRTTNGISAALGAILGHFGLRRKLRDFLRKLGVMK